MRQKCAANAHFSDWYSIYTLYALIYKIEIISENLKVLLLRRYYLVRVRNNFV